MPFKLILICLVSSALFCFSFTCDEPLPNPSSFGKQFIETIKKNNAQTYVQTFSMSKQEWIDYYNKLRQSTYLSDEEKSALDARKLEYNMDYWNAELKDNFKRIQAWIIKDGIDISKVEYEDITYTLESDKKSVLCLLDSYILIKHKSQLFRIRIFNAEYVNNRWVYGKIVSINKVDIHLNEIEY